ncbi:Complex III assembly factor lyrm7, variant 3 [Entomophthora muscae]|uniref:Complex III assembly factor lyrm7, variant 3 n=1 Tax=Entomophthora muscae TaxID=34485 RepID=A0ACC2SAJ4_9FUNG|nr:Complex III assembly factor lyrm7, variant 3 [Entomophthora muscae]
MVNLRAIRVYRFLLKTQRKCFKGDQLMINAAQNKTRSEFELFRLETKQDVIDKSLAYGLEVARVIEQNVAQAIIEKNNIMIALLAFTNICLSRVAN